jgi:hypothetical protein
MENLVSSLVPALVAGSVALIVVAINGRISWISHRVKLKTDKQLAVDRFGYEKELAERKIQLERDQYISKRNSEFSEKTIELFYEAHSKIISVRSPGSFNSENSDRFGRDEETEQVRAARDGYYPYVRRMAECSKFLNELHAQRYRAKSLFGPDAEKPFLDLWTKIHTLRIAAERLTADAGKAMDERQYEATERHHKIIWAGYADPDVYANDLREIVEQAERTFSPAITRPAPT